jgi:transposase
MRPPPTHVGPDRPGFTHGGLPAVRTVIGADTHRDTNHLAVITDAGKPLADGDFATSPAGYDDAVRWARSSGTVAIAGVEGTSSYGAGLTRVLQVAGIEVAEVSRPDRAARRRQGKSDPLDAYAAARSRWPAIAWPCPKTHTPPPCRRC